MSVSSGPTGPNPHVLAALRQVQLFRVLDAEGYQRLAEFAVPRRYGAGDRVVGEGDAGDAMFVVVHGEAGVSVSELGEDAPRRVATLKAGDFFGEMAVVGSPRRSATIDAEGALLLLEIPGPPLRQLLEDYPRLRDVILGVGLKRTEQNIEAILVDTEDEPDLVAEDDDLEPDDGGSAA
jgi:CRP-like cAMP-binding protein